MSYSFSMGSPRTLWCHGFANNLSSQVLCSFIQNLIFFFLALILGLQALSIYQNRDLITIYHGEQEGPNEFDTVLLKALVGGTHN